MKKTLIALAALASTAAFAQSTVNLTGKFGAAYTNGKGTVTSGAITSSTAKTSGFGVTDGDVVFNAVEDLGGGMKASASMAVRVRGRGAAGVVDGRDASVNVMGGFGTVTIGAVESGNGIIGLASAGAPVIGQDNGVTLDGAANVDLFQYTSPALIPGLTARLQIVDSIGAPGANGLQTAAGTQDATAVGVAYNAGPLAVNADFTSFGVNSVAFPAGTAAATVAQGFADSRTRISASYDLGMAKLGFGFQTKESTTNIKDKQMMLGVSVPMGAITLGATYATRNNDVDALDAKGFELGANYALSKRTAVQAAYISQKMDQGGAKATNFRVRVLHSF